MKEPAIYTHAEWRVRRGCEEEFIAAWDALATLFGHLPAPPPWGTLLRSTADPTLFYSFGPWHSMADVVAMRADPEVQSAFTTVGALCESMSPATYRVVRHVVVPARDTGGGSRP